MNYEREILDILLEAGDKGLTVKNISRHVHYEANSLFEEICYNDVYKDVRRFIQKESRNSYSILEHTQERGCYRLNRNSEIFSQLLLQFDNQ